MSELYPIFLKLTGRKCLVVGGGEVAERKIQSLLASGACVRVVSPVFKSSIAALAGDNPGLVLEEKNFNERDLDGAFIVIAATDNDEENRRIFTAAERLGLLVNVADDPELCNFYVPACVNRGSLQIAVSTAGKSPAFAKRIKEELAGQFGDNYTVFLDCLGTIRRELFERHPDDTAMRGRVLTGIVNSGLLEKSASSPKDKILMEMRKWISSS